MPPRIKSVPSVLDPYIFHGLDVPREADGEVICACPFCGAEKFSVNGQSGLWQCFRCKAGSERGGGNATTFLRTLLERSQEATAAKSCADLAAERGLLRPLTVNEWGLAISITTGDWLVPGVGPDGSVQQLYRWVKEASGKRSLRPTPNCDGHRLHAPRLFKPERNKMWVTEGIWDGMALYEVARYARQGENGKLHLTSTPEASILASTLIVAVQSCGAVGKSLEMYLLLFAGKDITLWFDSDHPRVNCPKCQRLFSTVGQGVCPRCGSAGDGRTVKPVGHEAAKRMAAIIATAQPAPTSISHLNWGPDGYDPQRPCGWDIRDEFVSETAVEGAV